MRHKILFHLLSVTVLAGALPAAAQSARPFMPPSTLQAKAGVKPEVPSQIGHQPVNSAPTALSPQQKLEEERKAKEEKEAAEKAEKERKAKEAEAERRMKLGLKEGQDLVEREFNGARVGMVNGVNIYKSADSNSYFYEHGDKRRYLRILSEDSVKAEATVTAQSNTPAKRNAGQAGTGESRPDVPSSVGRPAPRK